MKRAAKIFIIYFPITLVTGQVLANLLFFVKPSLYYSLGFYLNAFFGTNVFFAIFLLIFTFSFKFCEVSKWAAIAEGAFALNYFIVKEDGLYNILFQIIGGSMAIVWTLRSYIVKFPLCRLSLLWDFIKKSFMARSCEKGYEEWLNNTREKIKKHRYG